MAVPTLRDRHPAWGAVADGPGTGQVLVPELPEVACAALSDSATSEGKSDTLHSALISHGGRAGFRMPGESGFRVLCHGAILG
jgi:hypothetical protein